MDLQDLLEFSANIAQYFEHFLPNHDKLTLRRLNKGIRDRVDQVFSFAVPRRLVNDFTVNIRELKRRRHRLEVEHADCEPERCRVISELNHTCWLGNAICPNFPPQSIAVGFGRVDYNGNEYHHVLDMFDPPCQECKEQMRKKRRILL